MQYDLFLSFIFFTICCILYTNLAFVSAFLFPNYTLYTPRYTLILLYAIALRYTIIYTRYEFFPGNQLANGYVTNKTLPFINTRIHAKIEKIYQKRYLPSLKKRGTYVKVQSN